jgi:hypothetical protein
VVGCLSWGGGRGSAKHLGWMICFGVDCPHPSWTESYMENPAFIRASLSDVRAIMAIMRVRVEELSMSGGDGTDSSTRVPIVRRAWVQMDMSYHS